MSKTGLNCPEFSVDFDISDLLDINTNLSTTLVNYHDELSVKISELIRIVSSSNGEGDEKVENEKTNDLLKLAKNFFDIKTTAQLIKDNPDMSKSFVNSILIQLKVLSDFLNNNNVEVIDHTGENYIENFNYKVLEFIDKKIDNPIIKETIEPSIIINGKLVKQAVIIVEINKKP